MLTETMLNSLLQRAYLVLGCSWQREGGPRARMLLEGGPRARMLFRMR